MRTVRTVLFLAVALVIASPLVAQEKKKPVKKAPPDPAAAAIERITKPLDLTGEQKEKLKDICKEFSPKFKEAAKKMDVFTPEQKKARAEAEKEARAAGKKGKEFFEAVAKAVTLTDEQKAQLKEAGKEMGALNKELRAKVEEVLTPEQKEKIKSIAKPKPKPKTEK